MVVCLKLECLVGCQWLTPVILVAWEAEIGRIVVCGQPKQKICETPSHKPIAGPTPGILAMQNAEIGKIVI
jgi:hypothetical protein